jgi:hypothetical protein
MPFTSIQRPTARQMNTIINTEDANFVPSFTCTTTSYANFTGASLSFDKLMGATESDLRVTIMASGYLVASASINTQLGVNIASTDYDVSLFRFNQISVHQSWVDWKRISSIAAGTYTVQVRAKNDTASRSVIYDAAGGTSGGRLSLRVEEILL